MNKGPIFIHSLFRSGSTYLFNVFRRTGNYWCYQEPENEWLLELDENPEGLLAVTANNGGNIHHPDIGNPYFWEFHEVRRALKGLFKASFSFDDIFLNSLSDDQQTYYQALIDASRAPTVFQFCRSFGQPEAFKQQYGGIHVHLWREPRSQWWSFKINDYFDAATLLIFTAPHLPPALQAIKSVSGIDMSRSGNLGTDRILAEHSPLKWRENYKAFFALWLYAQLKLRDCVNLDLCIDYLTHNATYRNTKLAEFNSLGINDIDLSDSRSPLIRLTQAESAQMREIENQVANLFEANGFTAQEIAPILQQIDEIQNLEEASTSVAAANARGVALRLLDRSAESMNENRSLQSTLQRLSDHISSQDRAIKLLTEHSDEARRQVLEYDGAVNRLRSYSSDLEEALKKVQEYAENLEKARLDGLERIESLESELSQLRPAE